MNFGKSLLLVLVFQLIYTPGVQAENIISVLDFEEFEVGQEGLFFPSGFTSKGYIFEATHSPLGKSTLDRYYGIWGPDAGIRYTGQNAFRQNIGGGSAIATRMARADRKPFNLVSIDLWEHWDGYTESPQTVTFYGTDQDNNSVTQTFILDRTWGGQTFYFSSAFSDLKYVHWTSQGSTSSSYHQLDNVVLSAEASLIGDLNGDGLVDLGDLLLLQKQLLRLE